MSKTAKVLAGIILTPVTYFVYLTVSQKIAIKSTAYANNMIAFHLGKQKAYKFLRDNGRTMTPAEYLDFITENIEEIYN